MGLPARRCESVDRGPGRRSAAVMHGVRVGLYYGVLLKEAKIQFSYAWELVAQRRGLPPPVMDAVGHST